MPLPSLARLLFDRAARRGTGPEAAARPSRLLEKLEDRRLFDAAVAGDADPAAQGAAAEPAPEAADTALLSHDGQRASAQDPDRTRETASGAGDANKAAVRTEIVFIDPSLEDADRLLADLHAGSDPGRDFEVVLLGGDGLAQIGRTLDGRTGVDAVHILSHGEEGAVKLGDVWLTADTLRNAAGDVAGWGSALSADGDLLIYGCDLAGDADGRELLGNLATLTGADVAASDDATGHADLGGDWVLEYRNGEIQARGAISEAAQDDYRHLLAVGPQVTLDVPADVPIGQDFTFTATFENTGSDAGYGPFVDLLIPSRGADGTTAGGANDGVTFNGATYLGSAITATVLEFTDANGGVVDHPYAVDANGDPLQVTGTIGDTLVVLQLPFGSFAPEQPEAAIEISASVSGDADLGTALAVRARAGFQYGDDPLDNPASDPSDLSQDDSDANAWTAAAAVTPSLMTLTKTYQGPEDETATGPNHPKTYTIAVDVADGQTITDLDIFDDLPPNLLFESVVSVTGPGGAQWTEGNEYTVAKAPPTTHPVSGVRGQVRVNVGSVTGGAGADDVVVVLRFHVPEFDADAYDADGNLIADPEPHRIIPVSGEDDGPPSIVPNNARALGDWDPNDGRDAGGTDNAAADPDPANPEHVLDAKSIAVQKSVENVTDGTNTPGDLLKWTISFQISDYHTFGDLAFKDLFTDGQRFEFAEDAEFIVTDRTGTSAGTFNVGRKGAPEPNTPDDLDPANTLVVDESKIDFGDDAAEDAGDPGSAGTDGSTTLFFDLSEALIALAGDHADGVMHGGRTDGPNGAGAVGTLTFHTRIQQNFADTFPSGDRSVDHGDRLSNAVDVRGSVRDNADETQILLTEETDASAASLAIAGGSLTKGIAAINGQAPDPGQVVRPGDTVTYELKYTLPSSDFEELTLTDYLPQPVFEAGDPDADGVGGPAWTFDAGDRGVPPAPGVVRLGADDTFYSSRPGDSDYFDTADVSVVGGNAVKFDFGTYDDPGDQATTIHLLFTVTVSDAPFADGLQLTNIARAVESNTSSDATASDRIVQITLGEPDVRITKGAVSSDRADANFGGPVGPAAATFAGPGGAGFAGSVTSAGLAAAAVDADVAGLDAGDRVKFAIVLENVGGADASDLTVSDLLPAGFRPPTGAEGGVNLLVQDGNGDAVGFVELGSGAAAGLFGDGLLIDDPAGREGAANALSDAQAANGGAGDGSNVIVVTYDLVVADGVTAGQSGDDLENVAVLSNYAGKEQGRDHTAADRTDAARAATAPFVLDKRIVATSEGHTGVVGDTERVVVGEIVRYRLTVEIPEGTHENFRLQDLLPDGMSFLEDGTATAALVSDGGLAADGFAGAQQTGDENSVYGQPPQTPTFRLTDGSITSEGGADRWDSGDDPTFSFGTLENRDSDANREFVVVEFNAVADNSAGNTQGVLRDGAFRALADDVATLESDSVGVRIAEPRVTITQTRTSAAQADAGDTVSFELILTADGDATRATAFDVLLTDAVPDGLEDVRNLSVVGAGGAAGVSGSVNLAKDAVTVTAGSMAGGSAITVTFDATVSADVNPADVLKNHGDLTWTSLVGAYGEQSAWTGAAATSSNLETLSADSQSFSGGDGNARAYTADPGRFHGERTGGDHDHAAGTSSGANGYGGRATASLSVPAAVYGKTLFGTSDDHTADSDVTDAVTGETVRVADATIGETVTYALRVELPEGETPNLKITDLIPDGLDYESFQLVTTRAASENAAGTFLLDADFAGTVADPAATGGASAGDDVTFDFARITVAGDGAADNDAFLLLVTARVADVAGNAGKVGGSQTTLINAAAFDTDGDGTAEATRDAGPVTVVEPDLLVTKEMLPESGGQAGDTVTVSFKVENTGTATAFDLVLTDDLADGLFGNITPVTTPAGFTYSLNGDVVTFTGAPATTLAVGAEITFEFTADLTVAVGPNQTIANTAVADYSTRQGPATGERADTDEGAAALTTAPPKFSKFRFATSDDHTDAADVAIGETVTYALQVDLPEGTTAGLSLVDLLPPGLDYTGFRLVTEAIESFTDDGQQLLLDDFDGTRNGIGLAASDFTATGGAGGGDDVTFTVGEIVMPVDNTALNNRFLLLVDAVVVDRPQSAGVGPARTDLANTATLDVTGDTDAAGDPIGPQTSNTVTVTVAEPDLRVTKTAAVTTRDGGDAVTYTVTVSHTGDSHADAHDLSLTDLLADADLALVAGTVTATGTASAAAVTTGNGTNDATLRIDLARLDRGETLTVIFQATIADDAAFGDAVLNTASATFDGLEGAGGRSDTETGGHAFTLDRPTIKKERVGTSVDSATNARPDEAVVGELVTYSVTVTLPEGEVDGATVLDSLDPNLAFDAVQSVTFAGDVTSSETDFAPTVTGNALSFDFGTLTNPTTDDGGPQTVTLVYTARVRNVAAVQGETPTVLDGTAARFQWDLNGATAQTDADDAGDVTVIEPRLTVDVTASDTAGDAGDPVDYTITVEHAADSGTDAFDVTFSDPLPPELDVTGFTVTHPTLDDAAITGRFEVDPDTNEFRTMAGESFDLLAGQTLTITLETAPNGTLESGQTLDHTPAVRWTSLDGDEPGERTGTGGVDDYRASDAAPTFAADRPAIAKTLVGTSVIEAGNAADQAAVGELVTYRLEVTVPEGTTADATIADALPPGLDFVRVVSAAAGDGNVTSGGTPLTPQVLGSGADRRLEFDLGELTNADRDAGAETFVIVYEARVANAASNQADPATAFAGAARLDYSGDQSTTDSSPAGVDVVEPVVTIDTEVDDESPVLGQTVTYTLTVAADAGGATAHDLRVTDVLPAGVTLNPGSIVVGGVATPTDDPTGESVDLTLAELGPGGTVTITFTAEVTDELNAVGNTYADDAAVSWTSLAGDDAGERDGADGEGGALDDYRHTDADPLTVRNPDLSVTIDDGETAVAPGQTRTYAVTVTNAAGTDSADASGVTVTLPIDADVYSFLSSDDAANVSVAADGTLTWTPPNDLAPGGSVTLNVELRANATLPAGLDDVTLEATVAMDQIEPTPADTVEDDTDDVLATPDLFVATDDGGVRTAPDGSVVYVTTYGNRGPQGATGVTLTQTLPDGASFDAANSDPRWSLKSPGVYEITLTSLTAGATGSADFAVVTDATHPAGRDELATTAAIADDAANGADPTPADNANGDVTPLDAVPELAVTIGDADVTATPGGTVTYALGYANAGPQGATNATLTFTPPAGTTFDIADNPGWADAGDGTFTRNVGTLRPDGSDDGSVSVVVAVDPTHPAGRDELVAAVSLADDGANGPEANTANNAATEPTPLDAAPDVTVVLSAENPTNPAGGPATAGDPLVYTFDYENAGPQGATGVTLAFTPPPGVSIDPLANPDWFERLDGTWTRDVPDLASGDTGSVTFEVTLDDAAAAGREVLNASAEIDEDGANGPEPVGHEPNADSLVTPLAAAPDLVVTIDDGQPSTDTNDALTYTVTYDNVGDQDAGAVTLTVTPPEHTTVDQASLDAGWTLQPDGTYTLDVGPLAGNSGTPGSADFFVTVNDRVPAAVETLTAEVAIADAANEADPTPENNADDDEDTVGTTPDLFVVTTDDAAAVTPGGRVTYTVDYGNKPNGQDATGVFLTHVVPAGATFDPAASDPGWTADGVDADGNPVYRLNVGDVASGSAARTATFAVTADGPVDALREGLLARATVADDGDNGPDPNGPTLGVNDNEDPETTPLTALPDLFVTIDDGDAPLSAGGPLTLTVGYGNAGNQDVSGATLTIAPPAGTTVSAADCAANEAAGWVEQPDGSWTNPIGDLAADPADDGAVDFLVTVTDPVTAGRETIDSAASIRDAAADEETNRANNAATDTAPLAETPDLTVAVTADVPAAGVGDPVVFTLDYANVGDQHASGSFLTFTPPEGTTPDAAALAAGWTLQPDGSYRLELGAVNADATGSVTFGVTVDGPVSAGVESLTGTATVGDDGAGGPDPTPGNNLADDSFAVLAVPDLAVDTDDFGVTAVAGGTLSYAVTVRNLGDQVAGDVRVVHAIPAGTTLSAASVDGGWVNLGDGTAEFALGSLTPGVEEVIPFLVDVDDPAAAGRDRLDAAAAVRDAASPEPDADPTNNDDLEDTPLFARPDYVVTVDDGRETVGPGGRIRWTVTVENVGDQDGTGVVVTDRFPPGLLENVIASGGGAVDPATGVIRWDLGDLAGRGGTATFTVTGTIPAVLPAGVHSLTHTARVRDDLANGPDPTPANNADRDTDRLDFAPDLRVTVTDRRTRLEPGDRPTWTVTVTNAGNQGATGVVLRDQFPPGVLDAVIADGGASVNPRTGVVTWTVGDLAVGETRTFAVSGTVKDTLPAGFETLTHAADAADDGRNGADTTPANNAAADTDALDAAATLDVEIGPLADDLTPGDETDVTVTVTNRGDRDAGPTVLVVSFPKDVLDALEDRGYEVDARAGTVTFRFDDLPAGDSMTVDFEVRVGPNVGTTDFGVSAVASAVGAADAADAGAGAVTGVTFAFDAFRNEAEPGRTQFTPIGGGAAADAVTEDDRDPRTGRLPSVRPLFRVPARVPVSPMFTGTAEPGTMLTAKIYDADGNLVGERQTVADTAGNWLLSFPGTVLYEQPERMEFARTAAVQQAGGPGIGAADGQFALRRFFHPVGHASLFFSERPTVGGALGGAAGHALHAAHAANLNPLRFGFAARHWSLASASPTTGQA